MKKTKGQARMKFQNPLQIIFKGSGTNSKVYWIYLVLFIFSHKPKEVVLISSQIIFRILAYSKNVDFQ